MRGNVESVAEYFAHRAARYQHAQNRCPDARILDLIPYAYAIVRQCAAESKEIQDLRIFDAFGGAGFLSKSFESSGIRFTLGDCTEAYEENQKSTQEVLVSGDYFTAASSERKGYYDLVFAHGGMHHVYQPADNGGIDLEKSALLQAECLINLARLLKPGGTLILADIPEYKSEIGQSIGHDIVCEKGMEQIRKLLGEDREQFLNSATDKNFRFSRSLWETCEDVELSFRRLGFKKTLVDFFEEFAAKQTQYGHTAHYLNFDELVRFGKNARLTEICRINYPGAWLFENRALADWYFREKFSFGMTSDPPADGCAIEGNEQVSQALETFLGVNALRTSCAVNWGVTYSIFAKT